MINVLDLFYSFAENASGKVVGPDPVDEWNNKLNEVSMELLDLVAPLYQTNERVRGLVEPLIDKLEGSTDANGEIDKPDNYYRIVGSQAEYNNKPIPAYPVQENEVVMLYNIKQREPSLAKKNCYYLPVGDKIQFLPKEIFPYSLFYIRKPTTAKLVFSVALVLGEERIQYDATQSVQIEWGTNAFNLLLYKLQDKYGIKGAQDLLMVEYAKLGIQNDLVSRS